jgi:hypothetical protein
VIQITSDLYTLHVEWNYFAAFITQFSEERTGEDDGARGNSQTPNAAWTPTVAARL